MRETTRLNLTTAEARWLFEALSAPLHLAKPRDDESRRRVLGKLLRAMGEHYRQREAR